MNIEEITKRLAFIKYLYKIGDEQAKKPEPMCWAAILTLHDAVELFLQLIAENVGVNKNDIRFMEYWTLINQYLKKLNKPELPQKIAMERLNKARVAFKHYGSPPSKTAIMGDFDTNAQNFLEESTFSIFGIKFSEISLLDLISCQDVRNDLKKAEELKDSNKLEDSLNCVAIAFAKLIDDYEDRKTDKFGNSPFNFGRDLTFIGCEIDFGSDLSKLLDSIKALQEGVKIIGYGIDFKKYGKFKLLTPYVYHYVNGGYDTAGQLVEHRKIEMKDVDFCINFVIESALTLQEFDFELTQV
jgi:hypothetical protein